MENINVSTRGIQIQVRIALVQVKRNADPLLTGKPAVYFPPWRKKLRAQVLFLATEAVGVIQWTGRQEQAVLTSC
jgi:hypothetical protein